MGVQAHVLVLRRDLEQREDDQDEDEVYLTNPDFQLTKMLILMKPSNKSNYFLFNHK